MLVKGGHGVNMIKPSARIMRYAVRGMPPNFVSCSNQNRHIIELWLRVPFTRSVFQSSLTPDTTVLLVWDVHYSDVIMSAMVSQINSLTIIYSTVYSGAYQRKYESSASLAFVRGIHQWAVISPHTWPVTRKMFIFDDVIMNTHFPWKLNYGWIWKDMNMQLNK